MTRPGRVAVITTHIAPAVGYGGPSVSLEALLDQWSQHDWPVTVVSSDASTSGRVTRAAAARSDSVQVSLYRACGLKRWGFGLGAIGRILRACRRASVVYVNGIVTWPTTLGAWCCVLLRRPFVVAVRGGLMRPTGGWRGLYYRLLVMPTLRRAAAIHCTAAIESEAVVAAVGDRVPVVESPNGVVVRDQPLPPPDTPGLVLCFVGRIAREKGLNAFLRQWLAIRQPGERFIVAGDGDRSDPCFQEFQSLVAEADGAIEYLGYLPQPALEAVFQRSHFVVLPTGLGAGGVRENFGNAVAESLAVGRPALVCRGLAWDDLPARDAGVLIEPTESGVADAIAQLRGLSDADWHRMARAAHQYAAQTLDVRVAAAKVWRAMMAATGQTPESADRSNGPS